MGSEPSTLCSAGGPAAQLKRGAADQFTLWRHAGDDYAKPMQTESTEGLRRDRIDMWSKDLGAAAECSKIAHVVTCGADVQPPADYLADMQGGSIVLQDWTEGPFWKPDGSSDAGPDEEDWREGPLWLREPELDGRAEAPLGREPTWCEAHGAADSLEPRGQR
mmetsp:Transcript_102680/g.290374  ORF Transcript_102680/g.290374 Transcript_102680/m.290374 type:complete len:163 (+) Transcript_102680:60-548(+)